MREDDATTDQLLSAVGKMFAKLVRSDALGHADSASALAQLTETGAAALRVQRVSVWRFDDDRKYIECLDLFERSAARHSCGQRMTIEVGQRYFRALSDERALAVADALNDPIAQDFIDGYLLPNGITAFLDAPIWLSGRLAGVVCHEHTGAPRMWSPWEQLVAGTLGDFASVILGTAERARQAQLLSAHGDRLEQLVEERTRSFREEQRFLRTVFATAPFGMAFFDRDLRYLRINDWLAALNGVPSEQSIGRRPSDILKHGAADAERMIASVLETGRPTPPVELTGPDGRLFLVSAYPISTDGVVVQACCSVVEITAQRAGERERARLLELERQARQEAEAASRAKDEFLAMLGHELRNPLAPIQIALHLMERFEGVATEERAVIERQVAHLRRLVDDMLDVARITRGKLELQLQPIELADAVTKGIELASPLLEERGQFLDVEVAESGLCVNGDLDRLAQVVSNLLSNAAKFTPPGGRIRIQGCKQGDAELELSVIDSGQGIAKELLPRLFDAFVQGGHLALDRAQGGLGLGLAIVRGIVRAHGGEVTAESDGAERGSRFTVRVPRHVPGAEPTARATQAPGGPAPQVRRRILLVDDNEDVAELLARALARRGYETATAFDGPSALSLARQFEPEAAILDLGLPVMDGFEVAAKLKELSGGPALKLIALTGYGRPRDREQTRSAGFDAHLIKPVDVPALVRLLTSLFQS